MSISYTETIPYPQITALQAEKNSRTFKDIETKIQGLSRTNTLFKYFQGL